MFGLDHAQLRLGGEQIVKAEDDIGAAIFSAGSGLTQVSRVCEAIEEEAKAIWASRAGESRRYNAAAAAYQTARSILKASEVRPSAWLSARRELEGAGAALAKLRQDHARLTQEQRGVQRRQLVLPAATRRALAQSRLAELQQAPILSEEGAAACEAALADRERAQLLIAGAKAEIERLESELERAQPNPALLELADEIAALAEAKGQVDQGRGQMPELEGRRAQLRLAAGDLARELGWAHDDITQFRAKMPSRASLLALRELLDRRISIDEQAKGAREAARTAAALEARLRESVAGLPIQPDVRQIQELVREIRGAGLHRALDQAARTASELESELAARVRELAPWSGDVKALQSLQLPQDADVDHALQALQGASERASTEADAVRRSAERLSSLALDRKHAVLAHPAPTRQVLEEARQQRDGAWTELKRQLAGEAMVKDVPHASARFEDLVAVGDRLADERFAAAEHAGGLAALEREIEKAALELEQAEARRDSAEQDLGDAREAFQLLVQPLGLALSPEGLLEWRDLYRSALEAADAVVLAKSELERAQSAHAEAGQAILLALGRTLQPEEPVVLSALLAEADSTLEAAQQAAAEEQSLRGQLKSAQQALEAGRLQLAAVEEADAGWSSDWANSLAAAGLEQASPTVIRSHLETIEHLQMKLEEIRGLDDQLALIERGQVSFERRVLEAASQAGLAGSEVLELYRELHTAADEARTQSEVSVRLHASHEDARRRLDDAQNALSEALLALVALGKDAAETPADKLREMLAHGREASRLAEQIRAAEDEILKAGEGRSLESLLEEVARNDPDQLAQASAEINGALEKLVEQIETQSQVKKSAQIAFDALDDSPQAAIAAAQMAEARSEMAHQAELYIRKRAEARLLRTAIERYRQEKQGPLLARASSLFSTLTLGRFSRLLVDYEGEKPTLAGLREEGQEVVPVDGMSEGTVDQLFLALRVAAVEDAVRSGARLPFLADDLFINFDDSRAAAGFKVLAELARTTQVLFLTHHDHLADVANRALSPAKVAVCGLAQSAAT